MKKNSDMMVRDFREENLITACFTPVCQNMIQPCSPDTQATKSECSEWFHHKAEQLLNDYRQDARLAARGAPVEYQQQKIVTPSRLQVWREIKSAFIINEISILFCLSHTRSLRTITFILSITYKTENNYARQNVKLQAPLRDGYGYGLFTLH